MRAFSLVELSIVLVILGLLTGGILAGQSLIRAAELRSVSTEYSRYVTATQTFRDKYFALPGDMTNATRFWGDDNAACPDAAIANGTPGTCNGNGDSVMGGSSGNATAEIFQFWKQLALAGLIEGTYSGLSDGTTGFSAAATNSPASKIANGFWSTLYIAPMSGASNVFDGIYNQVLQVGALIPNNSAAAPIFRPEEAWNVDNKMDDGKPATGKVVVRTLDVNTLASCTTAIGTAAAQAASLGADYLLSGTAITCALVFKNNF